MPRSLSPYRNSWNLEINISLDPGTLYLKDSYMWRHPEIILRIYDWNIKLNIHATTSQTNRQIWVLFYVSVISWWCLNCAKYMHRDSTSRCKCYLQCFTSHHRLHPSNSLFYIYPFHHPVKQTTIKLIQFLVLIFKWRGVRSSKSCRSLIFHDFPIRTTLKIQYILV